jgi:hypothetical protein
MFWELVESHGMPVGFAGRTSLGVQKRRAELVLKELEKAQGPRRWFVLKAIEGFNSGKIARGRATAWCQIADQFFKFLAGSEEWIEDIRVRALGGTSVALVNGEYEGITGLEREILEYTICKHLKETTNKKGDDLG